MKINFEKIINYSMIILFIVLILSRFKYFYTLNQFFNRKINI